MLGFSMFSSFSTGTEILHWGKSKADACTMTCVHAPPSYSWQRKHGIGASESPLGPCCLLTQPLEQKTAPGPLEFLYLWLLNQGHIVQEIQRIWQSSAGILLSHSCSSYQLLSASWGCLSCSASVGFCLYSRLLSGDWKLLCHTNKVMLW